MTLALFAATAFVGLFILPLKKRSQLPTATLTSRIPRFAHYLPTRWLLIALSISAALSAKNPWLFSILAPLACCAASLIYLHRKQSSAKKRSQQVAEELPVVIELLALATSAGESPAAAMGRVARATDGHLGRSLKSAVESIADGATFVSALETLKRDVQDPKVERCIDAIILGYERGTSLGDVLHGQALDVREQYRRSLIELSAKAEIAMMIPVVFLIMPVTILFALFPSIQALTTT